MNPTRFDYRTNIFIVKGKGIMGEWFVSMLTLVSIIMACQLTRHFVKISDNQSSEKCGFMHL